MNKDFLVVSAIVVVFVIAIFSVWVSISNTEETSKYFSNVGFNLADTNERYFDEESDQKYSQRYVNPETDQLDYARYINPKTDDKLDQNETLENQTFITYGTTDFNSTSCAIKGNCSNVAYLDYENLGDFNIGVVGGTQLVWDSYNANFKAGENNTVLGTWNAVFGEENIVTCDDCVVGGFNNNVSADQTTVFGGNHVVTGQGGTAFGFNSIISGEGAFGVGTINNGGWITSSGRGSVAIGVADGITGDGNHYAGGDGSAVIGINNKATGRASISLGENINCYEDNQVCVNDMNANYYYGDGSNLTGIALNDTNFEDAGFSADDINNSLVTLQTATDNGSTTTNAITTGGLTTTGSIVTGNILSNYGATIYGNIDVDTSQGGLLLEEDFPVDTPSPTDGFFNDATWTSSGDDSHNYASIVSNQARIGSDWSGSTWNGANFVTDEHFTKADGMRLSFTWRPHNQHLSSAEVGSIKFHKPGSSRESLYGGERDEQFVGIKFDTKTWTSWIDAFYMTDATTGANNSYGTVRGSFTGLTVNMLGDNDVIFEVSPDGVYKVWLNEDYLGTGTFNATAWASIGSTYQVSFEWANYQRTGYDGYKDIELLTYAGIPPTIVASGTSFDIEVDGTTVGSFLADANGFQQDDGIKHCWGDLCDSYLQYDGTNLLLNPKSVGSGYFNVQGDVLIDEDLNITLNTYQDGNAFVNNIYGELNGLNSIATIGSSMVYFPIDDLNAGLLNGFTMIDANLIAVYDGVYSVSSQWAFTGGVTNEYHLSLNKNGVLQRKCHTERKIGSGGDVGSASYVCLIELNIGDNIAPVIENITSSANATINDFQLVITRVGN